MEVKQKNNERKTYLRTQIEDILEQRISIINTFGECVSHALTSPSFSTNTDNNELLSYGIQQLFYLCTDHLHTGIVDILKEYEKGL